MIRRQPTLIPLTDNDVQDVKDYLSKLEEQRQQVASASGVPQSQPMPPPSAPPTKEQRLGLVGGPSVRFKR